MLLWNVLSVLNLVEADLYVIEFSLPLGGGEIKGFGDGEENQRG